MFVAILVNVALANDFSMNLVGAQTFYLGNGEKLRVYGESRLIFVKVPTHYYLGQLTVKSGNYTNETAYGQKYQFENMNLTFEYFDLYGGKIEISIWIIPMKFESYDYFTISNQRSIHVAINASYRKKICLLTKFSKPVNADIDFVGPNSLNSEVYYNDKGLEAGFATITQNISVLPLNHILFFCFNGSNINTDFSSSDIYYGDYDDKISSFQKCDNAFKCIPTSLWNHYIDYDGSSEWWVWTSIFGLISIIVMYGILGLMCKTNDNSASTVYYWDIASKHPLQSALVDQVDYTN